MPQLALQQTVPAPQVVLPQASPPTHTAFPSCSMQVVPTAQSISAQVVRSVTQVQTLGDESKREPSAHFASAWHEQIPPQSAPPRFGSQSSLGSSTQLPRPGQRMPAIPPQKGASSPGPPLGHAVKHALAIRHPRYFSFVIVPSTRGFTASPECKRSSLRAQPNTRSTESDEMRHPAPGQVARGSLRISGTRRAEASRSALPWYAVRNMLSRRPTMPRRFHDRDVCANGKREAAKRRVAHGVGKEAVSLLHPPTR
jgi:hypothetical protein